jgi:hypothetical protein
MLVSKLPKVMEYYGIGSDDLDRLCDILKQEIPNSPLTREQLIKLYYGHTKRLTKDSLLDCCRLFGLTRVGQLIDFESAPEQEDVFLDVLPDSFKLLCHLPEIMKQQGRSQYSLERDTRMHANTISSWFHDFDSMNRFDLSSIEKIGQALQLQTIDQLFSLKVANSRGRRKRKEISSLFAEKEVLPTAYVPTKLPVLKTA